MPGNMNLNMSNPAINSNINRLFGSAGHIPAHGMAMSSNNYQLINNQNFHQQNLMDHSKQVQFNSNIGGMMNNTYQQHMHQNTSQQFMPRMNNSGNPFMGNQNSSNSNQDTRLKMTQQQLVLILHAQRCAQISKNVHQRQEESSCCYTYCPQAKKILSHVEYCTYNECQVDHCRSTKEILYHWRQCNNIHCSICLPVRIKIVNEIVVQDQNNANNYQIIYMNQYHNNITINKNPIFNNQIGINPRFMNQLSGNNGSLQLNNSEMNVEMNSNKITINQPNNSNSTINENNHGSNQSKDQILIKQDWQKNISEAQRKSLTQKLIAAIIPYNDISLVKEENKAFLHKYAVQTEIEAFENSQSIEEYRQALNNKISIITQKFHEKLKTQESPTKAGINNDEVLLGSTKRSDDTKLESSMPKKTKDSIEDSQSKPDNKKIHPSQEILVKNNDILENSENLNNVISIIEELINCPESTSILNFQSNNSGDTITQIKKNLINGKYGDIRLLNNSMDLLFTNCLNKYKKGTRNFKNITKLEKQYFDCIDLLMKNLGFCCGQVHKFEPRELICQVKKFCTIPVNQSYNKYGKYCYCETCFNSINSDVVEIVENITRPAIKVKKDQFEKKTNNEICYEELINCKICRISFHKVCVYYHSSLYQNGFICKKCSPDDSKLNDVAKMNEMSVKNLPSSQLGNFIENHINSFLEEQNYKSFNTTEDTAEFRNFGKILVRVVYNQEREFSTLSKFSEFKKSTKKDNDAYPEGDKVDSLDSSNNTEPVLAEKKKYSYKIKNIFVYQEIDGKEVCFFGLLTHEYGSNCPEPNKNRVYIAYLDSVKVFAPPELRTTLYHQILLGYLAYTKRLGYKYAHIWSCPPGENDDYMFYRHPANQQVLKVRMLSEWYQKMIDKGISQNIFEESYDLLTFIKKYDINDIKKLPYFEGDFWPSMIEDSISQIQTKTESANECDSSKNASTKSDGKFKKKRQQKSKKNVLSKKGINENSLYSKIYSLVEKYKEIFFVIKLSTSPTKVQVSDPDKLLHCDLMECRDNFLTFCRESNLEFSSWRRAVYSTLHFVFELHNQFTESYTCNNCSISLTSNYHHCSECEDYDLCNECYSSNGHVHQMNLIVPGNFSALKLGSKITKESSTSNKHDAKTNFSKPQRYRLQLSDMFVYNNLLTHSISCIDSNCSYGNCVKFKKIIIHYKSCSKSPHNKTCALCQKFLSALFLFHSKNCTKQFTQETSSKKTSSKSKLINIRDNCEVPLCQMIHDRLQIQNQKRKAQEESFIQNRISMVIEAQNENQEVKNGDSQKINDDNSNHKLSNRNPEEVKITEKIENNCESSSLVAIVQNNVALDEAKSTNKVISSKKSYISKALNEEIDSKNLTDNKMSDLHTDLTSLLNESNFAKQCTEQKKVLERKGDDDFFNFL